MAELNLTIDQGCDFSKEFTWYSDYENLVPENLTGYTGKASIRATYESGVLATFTFTINVDPTTGNFTISLTNAQTAALVPGQTVTGCQTKSQIGVWDLIFTSQAGTIRKLLNGKVYLNVGVTK